MNYKTLSNSELLAETYKEVQSEREAGIRVLHCIREIELRGLYLTHDSNSLHEFLVSKLRYSDGAAHRRINAMRLLRELPQVETKLRQGKVTLTTVSQIQDFLMAEASRKAPASTAQKLELLESITDKSSRATQAMLAERSPESAIPEKVKMISEEQALVQFKASRELLEQLDELKALLVHALESSQGYGGLIAKLAERVLKEEKKKRGLAPTPTPRPTQAGRPNQPEKAPTRASAEKLVRKSESTPNHATPHAVPKLEPNPRFPSRPLQRLIWKRAQARCERVDPKTRQRCTSRFALETDHVIPWALGGRTEFENLQLLCAAHHRKKTKAQLEMI